MVFLQVVQRAISYVWDSTKATNFSPDSSSGSLTFNTDSSGNLTSLVETRTDYGGSTYVKTTTITNPTSTQQVWTDGGWVKQP